MITETILHRGRLINKFKPRFKQCIIRGKYNNVLVQ